MKEKNELVEHIYKDASMGSLTCKKLVDSLKEKDNKIKGCVEDILKEYQSFERKAKKMLKKENEECSEEGFMAKMMAKMGIQKEVMMDNSDSAIAKMLIEGITMGSLEMNTKIKDYEKEANKEAIHLAKDFLKFQEKEIENLKKYL